MSIPFTCECGKTFHVKGELGGRRGKYPACGRVSLIPKKAADSGLAFEGQEKATKSNQPNAVVAVTAEGRILFSCPCGEAIWVTEELAGKKAKCPTCRAVVVVPRAHATSRTEKRQPVRGVRAATPQYVDADPPPTGDGLCSDNSCPCPDVVIPHGQGYLYVEAETVEFRRQYPRLEDARRAAKREFERRPSVPI